MKILELIPLLSIDGGAESFVVYFSNELIRQGHKCAILTLYTVDEQVIDQLGLSDKVKLYSVNKQKGIDLNCLFSINKIIKDYCPDVVHVHVGAISYITFPALLNKQCKFFATIHSEARREAGRFISRWARMLMFKSGRVSPITISEQSTKSFVDLYKINPIMIYNGVPEYKSAIKDRDFHNINFIHVARCHPIKNQILLLSAFKIITERYNNVSLDWFGDNSEYGGLFNTLEPFFDNNIRYRGSVSDARQKMSTSSSLCLTSKMEGMPITIIEAMSVGCVPIATPVGGCVNMIKHNENGLLSRDLTVESYVEVLEYYINMPPETKRELSLKSVKSYYENFSIEKIVNNYLIEFSK